jgi:hypothetical protein
MIEKNATNTFAKYPTLEEYAKSEGLSLASVLRACGKNPRNPNPYKKFRVVINGSGDISLQREDTIRAFI